MEVEPCIDTPLSVGHAVTFIQRFLTITVRCIATYSISHRIPQVAYRQLRALRPLLFLDVEGIVASPAVGESISVSLVAHHLFSHAPEDILPPHNLKGWTFEQYVLQLSPGPLLLFFIFFFWGGGWGWGETRQQPPPVSSCESEAIATSADLC